MDAQNKKTEALLYSVFVSKQRLINYERKLSKAIQRSGPSGVAPIDLTKPSVHGSHPEADLDDMTTEIARLTSIVQGIKDEIGDILTTISQLSAPERRLIEMWYFRRMTKSKIAEALNYANIHSIYILRDKALTHFTALYPW